MTGNKNFPNFFILGSAKCGTTALYEVLKNHPDIYFPLIKEPQFFCNEKLYAKGIDFYLKTYFSDVKDYKAIGEATPHYLYYEKVAKRISNDLPEKNHRFIIILRNPVKRAYSLYWNMVKEGYETLSFTDAVEAESERLKDPMLEKMGTLKYMYLNSGFFGKEIDAYLKYFSKDKFLILFQEDLIKSPEKVYDSIFKFLNIKDIDISEESKVNHNEAAMPRFKKLHAFLRGKSGFKRLLGKLLPVNLKYLIVTKLINTNMKKENYPKLDQELEIKLKKHFLADIIRLEEITGRNLDHWK